MGFWSCAADKPRSEEQPCTLADATLHATLTSRLAAAKSFWEVLRRTSSDQLGWVQRCPWRDKLDTRAKELERNSVEFDEMKCALDTSNEELQWQATSAEALRMRTADLVQATAAEDARLAPLRSMQRQHEDAISSLQATPPPCSSAVDDISREHGDARPGLAGTNESLFTVSTR